MAITKVTGALVDIGDLDLTNVGTLHLDSIVSDASPAAITIGYGPADTLTINGLTTMTTDGNGDTLTLTSTDTDANAGPVLNLNRPVTGADDDLLGGITFAGQDDANNATDYASIQAHLKDASDSVEDGLLDFQVMHAGTSRSALLLNGGGTVVVNQDAQDIDFRVESDSKTHALFVDAGNGQVLLNTSTARQTSGVTSSTQIHGTGYNDASLTLVGDMGANALTAPVLFFAKTRGSAGASTSVSSGDRLGAIFFNGADGTDINTVAASIDAVVDGTPGSDDMPGRLTFRTSADGSGSNAERMRIDSAGHVTVTDGNLIIGTSGHGIDFSATADGDNSGSGMSSELLDDYEEGQHTTTVTGNTSGSWSLSSAGDEYTYCKIGRTVHCHGYITVTGESSSVGAIGFTLPFTAISGGASGDVQDDGEYSLGTMALINGGQNKAANNYVFVQSGDKAYLYYVSDTGNGAYYDSGDVDTAWAFGFSFTYTAA